MPSISKFTKLSTLGVGALTISGLLYYDSKSPNPLINLDKFKNKTVEPVTTSKWDFNWDRRHCVDIHPKSKDKDKDSEEVKKHKTKAVRHIILIRHGQYNMQGKTDEERSLTDLGRVQAEATGLRLKELKLPYTQIVRSTMKRAMETSQLIEEYLPTVPVKSDSILVEGAPIPPDPPAGHWKPEKTFFTDGPRIEAAFRKYFYRAEYPEKNDSYTVLVCHGNVIRYMVCRALQFPPEAWLRMSIRHGSITWLTIGPTGRVSIKCFNETGHMLPEWLSQ